MEISDKTNNDYSNESLNIDFESNLEHKKILKSTFELRNKQKLYVKVKSISYTIKYNL